MRRVRLLALAGLLLLAACGTYEIVPARRIDLGGGMSVEPRREWNRHVPPAGQGKPHLSWTLDGPVLHQLLLFPGLGDGEALFETGGVDPRRGPPPVYRSAMTPNDIAELIEASMTRSLGSPAFRLNALKAFAFAGAPGFRIEFAFAGRDEIEREGVAIGTVRGGRLYLLIHEGTALHHFGRYLPEVEAIAASARIAGR